MPRVSTPVRHACIDPRPTGPEIARTPFTPGDRTVYLEVGLQVRACEQAAQHHGGGVTHGTRCAQVARAHGHQPHLQPLSLLLGVRRGVDGKEVERHQRQHGQPHQQHPLQLPALRRHPLHCAALRRRPSARALHLTQQRQRTLQVRRLVREEPHDALVAAHTAQHVQQEARAVRRLQGGGCRLVGRRHRRRRRLQAAHQRRHQLLQMRIEQRRLLLVLL